MVKVPVPPSGEVGNRPTVLLVGRGEPMDAALRLALDRHKLAVEEVPGDVRSAVLTMAPDLVLLVGDAARDGGRKILDQLSGDASVAAIPVAVLGAGGKLDARVAAYRHGAVAVIPRTASADAIATRVAILVREIQERAAAPQAELGEATFDELVDMVSRELRSGILSVQSKDGEPMRVVLGAGRPVAAAVEEFVRRLRPLVARAEPLNYELHVSSGGQVGLLDAEPGPELESVSLEGLRVLLVDTDPARADALAQELRARKVVVSVADASGRGLERARGLDPEIVILDAAGMEGPGFDVLRSIRRDARLRWASMLVAPWDEIWPDPESIPDVARLAERIAPLVVHDRQLKKRALTEEAFDTRLESTGPCRLFRILAETPESFHVTMRSRNGSVEVDIAEGLIVGAQGSSNSAPVEGVSALAAILAMGSARVHIERRANPATANLMMPVEEALARATEEAKPLPLSQPPPPQSTATPGMRKRPFPAASELKEQGLHPKAPTSTFASVTRDEPSSVAPRAAIGSRVSAPLGGSKGLSWSESEEGSKVDKRPVEKSSPKADPKAAFAALFDVGPPAAVGESLATAKEENTAIYDSNELARLAQSVDAKASGKPDPKETSADRPGPPPRAPMPAPQPPTPAASPGALPLARGIPPRKQTLVMGPLLRAPALPTTGAHAEPQPPRGEPANRNPTLTMGSAPPAAKPDRSLETKGAALSAFGPLAKTPRSSTPPPNKPGMFDEATLDQPSTLEELVSGVTSLPPESEGSTPLASVSAAPPSKNSDASLLTSADAVFVDSLAPARDDADTVTNAAPLAPPLPSPKGGHRPQDIGMMATLPAGVPGVPPLPQAPASPAPIAALPPVPPSPRAEAISASAMQSVALPTEGATRGDPTTPISGWPTPPAADTIRTPSLPSPKPRGPRALAWVLVGLGSMVLLGVGAMLVWSRVLGHALPWEPEVATVPPSHPDALTNTAGTDAGPSVADAGSLVAAVLDAGSDAPLVLDAGAPLDAGIDAPLDAGSDAGADAGTDAPVLVAEEEVPTDEAPPDVSGSDPVAQAAALVARAEEATDPVAETLYRQALGLDPRNHYAMLGIAEILMRRGEPGAAIPLIENAISRRRNRAAYRVLLGDARRDAGDAAGARRAWEEALEVDPENRAARARLGM